MNVSVTHRTASLPPKMLLLGTALAVALLLGFGIAAYWPWISDDAFISLRYAARLVAGDGLTWNDGEAVEGYSNLSWVLLAAGLLRAGFDAVDAVRALGLLATALTFVALARASWLRDGGAGAVPLGGVVLLAAQAPVALWTIGGLETPLALLLTTVGFATTGEVLAARDKNEGVAACTRAGLAFALLAWTRPDGPLWGALACLALVVFARRGPTPAALRRRFVAMAAPIALAVVAQLAFRLAWHGDWVPNTAHVKLAGSAATLQAGLTYLDSAAHVLRSLLLPAAIGAVLGVADPRLRPFALLATAAAATWAGYVATIGGDLFPLCRILVPALGPLALLAALGFAAIARRTDRRIAWLVVLGAVIVARADARLDPGDPFQRLSRWEWQGRAVGEWLARAFAAPAAGPPPLLALDAAGAVPFYSGLPCLDMLGLCDRHIAKAPPPRPDHVVPGHSRGDGAYVLDRAPDLVLFASPTGEVPPRWPGGWQMEADPRFVRDYRCVVFRTGPWPVVGEGERDLAVTMWARTSGRIGVRRDGDGWLVPGWLCGGHRLDVPLHLHDPAARPGSGDQLARRAAAGLALRDWHEAPPLVGVLAGADGLRGEIRRRGSFACEALPLPPGDYTAVPEPALDGVAVTVVRAGDRLDLRFDVAATAPLPARLAAVRLVRAAGR